MQQNRTDSIVKVQSVFRQQGFLSGWLPCPLVEVYYAAGRISSKSRRLYRILYVNVQYKHFGAVWPGWKLWKLVKSSKTSIENPEEPHILWFVQCRIKCLQIEGLHEIAKLKIAVASYPQLMHGKFLDSTTVPLCRSEPIAFKNAHEKDPNRTQPVQNPNRISPHKGRSPATRR